MELSSCVLGWKCVLVLILKVLCNGQAGIQMNILLFGARFRNTHFLVSVVMYQLRVVSMYTQVPHVGRDRACFSLNQCCQQKEHLQVISPP